MRSNRTTSMTDDDGQSHEYSLIQHGASEGFDLLPRMLEVVGEPIAVALLGDGSSDVDLDQLRDGAVEMELSLRGDLLGPQITTFCRRLVAAGGAGLVRDLLKYTQRDGKPLADRTHFDAAFQGNYGELMMAVKWAITENFAGALGRLKHPTSPAAT